MPENIFLCFDLIIFIRKAFWEALWGQVVGIEATKSQHQTNSVDSIPTIIEKWGGSTIKNSGRQRHTLTHSSIIWLGINIYTFLNFALQFNEHYFAFLEFRMANKFHQIILLTTVNPTRTMVYCLSAQEIKSFSHKKLVKTVLWRSSNLPSHHIEPALNTPLILV